MKKILMVLMLGWGMPALAQNTVTFTGVVKDVEGTVLELSNVVAYHMETDRLTSYGVTDEDGRFYLKLEENTTYVLRSTFIGYHTSQDTIVAKQNDSKPFVITLKPNAKQLANITIEEEFPVMISGDTISYKADAFKNGTERKLEDVLEGIPGFDVDANGDIKIQGKSVEKILVEGREFFEGDTKLAVQNIPANAVDKVQVLRNFSDISPMGAVGSNDDRLAINIRLTEDKKNMTFGDVEAGGGLDSRYLSHANLFHYSKKATVNFIGDVNNIGREAFTPRDYFRFMGGMRNMAAQSGSSFSITDDNMGFMNMQSERALSVDTKLGAANFNATPNTKWNLSGFAIVSTAKTNLRSLSERTYINSESAGSQETLATDEYQKNLSGLAKVKARYTPTTETQMEFEFFAKGSSLDDNIGRVSNNLGSANTINEEAEQSPLNLNQRLDIYHALNDRNIVSTEISYEYNKQNPFSNYASDLPLFSGVLPIDSINRYQFTQSKNVISHQQELVANWYYILNKTNHLNFRFGNNYVNQQMTSAIGQEGNAALGDEAYHNDFNYRFTDLYTGLNWRSRIDKLELNPGIYAHRYKTIDDRGDQSSVMTKTLWLPEFTISYDITGSQTLRFRYNLEARFMDIQKVAQGLIVQNYNNLYQGNTALTNSTVHNFNLNYTNYSLFSHFSIFGGLNYQKIKDNISESAIYQGLERLNIPVNVSDWNELVSFYGDVEKTFKAFKVSTGANLFYSSTSNLINQASNQNKSFTQQYELSLEAQLARIFTVEVGYERTYNQYSSTTTENDYINDRPFFEIEIAIRPWLSVLTDYEYNNYRAEDGSSESIYKFLNASLVVQKEKSPWQFTLSGTNLLETEAIRRDSFSDNLVGTYTYFVQPRYFTLAVKYDL